MRRLALLLALLSLFGCAEAVTRTDVRFSTPEHTVQTLLGAYGLEEVAQETIRARMAEGGGFESWEDRAAYSIACHTSIRAGKILTLEEMSELTRQLEDCEQPHTCPHGRPTMVYFSLSQLEREFGRR